MWRHVTALVLLLLQALSAQVSLCQVPAPPGAAPAVGQSAITSPTAAWSREEMEEFLQRARITRERGVQKGVTGTSRVTLTDGPISHDASVQPVDESRPRFQTSTGVEFNFRDTWRFNLAAYLLDKELGIGMIPATVERHFRGKPASFTWWVDDVLMDEGERLKARRLPPDQAAWNQQMWIVRVFDQLIDNTDRNTGNLLITSSWRLWMIDHTRAFRWSERPRQPANLTRCDRGLLERMRALDAARLREKLREYLGPKDIETLLARRDAIVAHFDRAGAQALYDLGRTP